MKHIKLKTVNLKSHPQLNEKWLQDIIADDPSIIGVGDVILKDKERIHIGAGRLDLLLQDADGHGRYEVEIQLGATDESHIIRTIEYWDIEKKKYPQYDHTAVIIAEDITSRFLNVIGLFNGFIPIIAIQVTAIETPEGIGLQFTKILDTVKLGYLGEQTKYLKFQNHFYLPSNLAITNIILVFGLMVVHVILRFVVLKKVHCASKYVYLKQTKQKKSSQAPSLMFLTMINAGVVIG